MNARMSNPAVLLPDALPGVMQLSKAVNAGGVEPKTLELVHLRASQINGCSACVAAGVKSATAAGVPSEQLLHLAAWYESPHFDESERAALRLTEAATRLADRPGAVTDEIWDEAARHFDEKQLAALVLHLSLTNFFNRVNSTVKEVPGANWG